MRQATVEVSLASVIFPTRVRACPLSQSGGQVLESVPDIMTVSPLSITWRRRRQRIKPASNLGKKHYHSGR